MSYAQNILRSGCEKYLALAPHLKDSFGRVKLSDLSKFLLTETSPFDEKSRYVYVIWAMAWHKQPKNTGWNHPTIDDFDVELISYMFEHFDDSTLNNYAKDILYTRNYNFNLRAGDDSLKLMQALGRNYQVSYQTVFTILDTLSYSTVVPFLDACNEERALAFVNNCIVYESTKKPIWRADAPILLDWVRNRLFKEQADVLPDSWVMKFIEKASWHYKTPYDENLNF